MTEKGLRELLEVWKKRLGLENWRIELEIGGVETDSAYMDTARSVYYDRAKICVQPWLLGTTPKVPDDFVITKVDNRFIECRLVHELLHCCVSQMAAVVNHDLDGFLHRDVDKQLYNSFHRAEEIAVDRMAEALVTAFQKGA